MASQHSAPDVEAPAQAAGYIYQLRYALHRALKRIRRDPSGSIGIERLDDVSLENPAGITVEQLKHTTDSEKSLSINTPSLWRTLGNWSRYIKSDKIKLPSIEFIIVTNMSLSEGSPLQSLSVEDDTRDVEAAISALKESALNSENQKTKSDRADFMLLSDTERHAMVSAIRIVPDSPNLAAMSEEIEDLLHYVCEANKLQSFRQALEGWWLERVAEAFSKGDGFEIALLEIDTKVSYLREKYKSTPLQIDIDDPPEDPDGIDSYTFVEQIRIIKAIDARLRNAQRDFLKASAQRSKWIREAKIDPIELKKYDEEIEERWEKKFSAAVNELMEATAEDEKCKVGRILLSWAEAQEVPLKGAAAPFLTSGSYHALADAVVVGWHPDFQKIFKK